MSGSNIGNSKEGGVGSGEEETNNSLNVLNRQKAEDIQNEVHNEKEEIQNQPSHSIGNNYSNEENDHQNKNSKDKSKHEQLKDENNKGSEGIQNRIITKQQSPQQNDQTNKQVANANQKNNIQQKCNKNDYQSPVKKNGAFDSEEDRSIRQKLFNTNDDQPKQVNEDGKDSNNQQVLLDQSPSQIDNCNFNNISQEIVIQGLSGKKPTLIGINISPNSKITINRELSTSYFGDHEQDDRSIYQEQEQLYSPTLSNQKTTKSKNESDISEVCSKLNLDQQQQQYYDKNGKRCVSEFNAQSPKVLKNEIVGYADEDITSHSDVKQQSQSKIKNSPTSSPTNLQSRNIYSDRDNTKKLSIKIKQVELDEEFIKKQQLDLQNLNSNQNTQSADIPQKMHKKNSFNSAQTEQKQQHVNPNKDITQKDEEEDEDEEVEEDDNQNKQQLIEDDEDEDEEEEEYDEEEEEEKQLENNMKSEGNKIEINMNSQNGNNQSNDQMSNYNGKSNNLLLQFKNEEVQKYEYPQKQYQSEQQLQQVEIRVQQHDKQVYLRVSKIQDGIATLMSEDYSQVEMPIIFLPQDITCGSVVKLSIDREYDPEEENCQSIIDIQQTILNDPNFFS